MPRPVFGTTQYNGNANPTGIGNGTPGGRSGGMRGQMSNVRVGDEGYLWLLILLEVLTMVFLRNHFKRYHGG